MAKKIFNGIKKIDGAKNCSLGPILTKVVFESDVIVNGKFIKAGTVFEFNAPGEPNKQKDISEYGRLISGGVDMTPRA